MIPVRNARALTAALLVCILSAAVVAPLPWDSADSATREAQRQDLLVLSTSALNHSLRYLHTTWWTAKGYSEQTTDVPGLSVPGLGSAPTQSLAIVAPPAGFGANGDEVRGQAMAAYATAIALKDGLYDARVVGVSSATARRRTIEWVSGLSVSYQRDRWAHTWESPLWVYYTAYAAKQVWSDLPSTTRELIASDVSSEADGLLAEVPHYYEDATGTILHPGDTKAEEDAWTGNLLLFAAREFPSTADAQHWDGLGRWFAIAAWATPDEIGSDPRITGSNVSLVGTVANHGILVNPDYMLTDAEFTVKSALVAADTHTAFPREVSNNFRRVWWGLTVAKFASPPYLSPGGTIYRRADNGAAAATLYFPLGPGWSVNRRHTAALMDCQAFVGDIDPDSYSWAKAHLSALLAQQSRHADGCVFSPGETTFPLEEQLAAACEAEMAASLEVTGQR